MSPLYAFFLLLPVAFVAGWAVARRVGEHVSGARAHALSSDYFRGLNYLLNEEQDKAIEVFLRLAEYNEDTIETHLALGNLFRRRGEVDRAIRVHQHLVSRLDSDADTRLVALLELGEDYMRAGLLDRAEALFLDLASMDAQAPAALRHLISIYQHERDWHEAIRHALRLEAMTGESQAHSIAHFHCELAEQSRNHGAWQEAQDYLQKAIGYEHDCVRAHIIQGQILAGQGHHAEAMDTFERALMSETDFAPDVLPMLLESYRAEGQLERAEHFLERLVAMYGGISAVLALAEVRAQCQGKRAAVDFLTTQLRKRPSVRGMMALIEATLEHTSGDVHQDFLILRDLAHKILDGQAKYRCTQCGFSAKGRHWQCPSCKQWGTVRPIRGVTNE